MEVPSTRMRRRTLLVIIMMDEEDGTNDHTKILATLVLNRRSREACMNEVCIDGLYRVI